MDCAAGVYGNCGRYPMELAALGVTKPESGDSCGRAVNDVAGTKGFAKGQHPLGTIK